MSKQKWESKYHVKSSMDTKENQYNFFIGRFQPLHEGHKALFQQVLDEGGKVLIGIREIEADEKNPFTAIEVHNNVSKYYEDNINVKVIIIPDIKSICFGRGVGYDIIEHIPPQEIYDISATKIREQMNNNK